MQLDPAILSAAQKVRPEKRVHGQYRHGLNMIIFVLARRPEIKERKTLTYGRWWTQSGTRTQSRLYGPQQNRATVLQRRRRRKKSLEGYTAAAELLKPVCSRSTLPAPQLPPLGPQLQRPPLLSWLVLAVQNYQVAECALDWFFDNLIFT